MEIFRNKKIRILVIIIGVALLAGLIIYSIYAVNKNPYGDQLEIANLDEYTAGKPTDKETLDYIKHDLFIVADRNTEGDLKSNSIDDVIIRKDSFSQEFNDSVGVHTVHFIVDIASIKQSYKVSYQWVTNPSNNQYIDEYGTQITCLPIDELIYGEFNCVDDRIAEGGVENYDPIQPLLPYHVTGKYKIVDFAKNPEEDTITLEVEAYTPAQMYRLDQATLDSYTKDINEWLTSRKLDPKNYRIHYIY